MKFSEAWVREWVNPNIDTAEMVAQLTMAGLEVDSVEPVAGKFSGVVVGEILHTEPHPNADKLRVCKVNSGDEELQIVCGAPNARPGIRVPLAKVGATLPNDFKIKKAKLRDVESFGMLCAREELGVSGDSAGLWELPQDATVGADLNTYLALDDHIIEVDLTPNRADCLSIRGLAREVGTLNDAPVSEPEFKEVKASIDDFLPVELNSVIDCPVYLGRIIKGVNLSAATPLWMQQRLERSDIGCINPIVDVTNYILLELGQPMHAFDLSRLTDGIQVRRASSGENLELLDGRTVELNPEVLVIADRDKPVAMAGIMGGEESSVTEQTRDIFLESAFFNPLSIIGKAREFGLHTDSSHRFERGVDYELQALAIERATQLILEICGGEAGPVTNATSAEDVPLNEPVRLRKSRVELMLGTEFSTEQIQRVLNLLGMHILHQEDDSWTMVAPSWRFDINIEADLVEEIARIYGYNNLPERTPAAQLPLANVPENRLSERVIPDRLVAQGYREVISYSFIDPKVHQACFGDAAFVEVTNPISADMSVMRTSLLPGLLSTVEYNLKRQHPDLALFENGLVFVPTSEPVSTENLAQIPCVAGALVGVRESESWANRKEKVDFYDAKRDVELLLGEKQLKDIEFKPCSNNSLFHPGQCAAIIQSESVIGHVGAIHPAVTKKLDIDRPVFAFELTLESLLEISTPAFKSLGKFPEVRRDIALIVDQEVSGQSLIQAAKKSAGETLSDARIFDIYVGQGIDSNKKSVAIGLTFRDYSRTLNDEEVTALVEGILSALTADFGAVQR